MVKIPTKLSAEGKAAFNSFITGARSAVDTALASNGVTAVDTGYVFLNPSGARDVVTDATANSLTALGTDNYPENGLTTPTDMESAMQTEMNDWVVPSHPATKKNITFGPSVYSQLSEANQTDALTREFNVIKNTITNLNGITVWQFGAIGDSPLSRLFESASNWTARSAASAINTLFGGILSRLSNSSRGTSASRSANSSRDSNSNRTLVT